VCTYLALDVPQLKSFISGTQGSVQTVAKSPPSLVSLSVPKAAAVVSVPSPSPVEHRKASFELRDDLPPYENVNLSYVAALTQQGYAHDAVIRALGVARNDMEMACDILHEFATKQ